MAVLLFIASRLTKIGFFTLDTIQVNGADKDIEGSIREIAASKMQGDYLGLFSRSSIFGYPRSEIAKSVASSSPRIKSVIISHDGLNTLKIDIVQKTPSAIVCLALPDLNFSATDPDESSSCYYTDQSGFIFEKSPLLTGQIYERMYFPDHVDSTSTADSSADRAIGSYATTTAEFQKLSAFYSALVSNGFDVQGILAKPGGEYECYVQGINQIHKTSSPEDSENIIVIYFNDSQQLSVELSDLISFWSRMKEKADTGGSFPQFEYIDIRFVPNVFYRLAK